MPVAGVEGNNIASNGLFVAVPWKSGGGNVAIRNGEDFGRFGNTAPMFLGHKGPI